MCVVVLGIPESVAPHHLGIDVCLVQEPFHEGRISTEAPAASVPEGPVSGWHGQYHDGNHCAIPINGRIGLPKRSDETDLPILRFLNKVEPFRILVLELPPGLTPFATDELIPANRCLLICESAERGIVIPWISILE
jgi:hypothetical protein